MNYEDRVTKQYIESALANAGVRIATGTYTGDGKYGSSHRNSSNGGFAPKLVIVMPTYYGMRGFFIRPASYVATRYDGNCGVNISWSSTGVSWYTDSTEAHGQLNGSGETYRWFAIG